MRILVTGAGGQLGAAIASELDGHDLVLLDHGALEVSDEHAVRRTIGGARADVIIHAAAWTDVDACEGDPARAELINARGTANVAGAAGDALVILLSTDYVFDGDATEPYVEDAPTNPVQAYGRSKLMAELAVSAAAHFAIVRTAWLYGARRADGSFARNFITSILRAATTGPIDVVSDQVGSPTSTHDLARALGELAARGATGTFHVVNEGAVSRADLARAALTCAGMDPGLVRDIETEPGPRTARRPAYAPLATAAWREAGFDALPRWDDALARAVPSIVEAL